MPMSHVLSCDRCGAEWRWLQMTAREPLPSCPNPQCGHQEVSKELAAPAIGRDASPQTQWVVPPTRAGREKFAYEMAQGMGFTDMKDNLREGDVQAPRIPDPVIRAPNGREIKVPMGFTPSGPTPEAIASTVSNLVGGGGGSRVNSPALNVLGGMKKRH